MPSADHVNTYSNLLATAGVVESCYNDAVSAYENAKSAWDELAKKKAGLEASLAEYRGIEIDYRRLQSQISPSILENNPERVNAVLQAFSNIVDRVAKADDAWKALVETDGGWTELRRKGDSDSALINENLERFDGKLAEARRLRGHGIDWVCVRNVYEERVARTQTEVESLRKNLAKRRDSAAADARAADNLQSQIGSFRESVDAFPGIIAANNLRQEGISGAKQLMAFLADRALPRVAVRFRSAGVLVPDGELSLKKGVDPLNKIDDPVRPGFVFLGWSERNTGREFTAWGEPVGRDLDLDAVFGYEVRVAGSDATFPVKVEGGVNPTLAKVFLDPKFVSATNVIAAPAGKRLAGWRDYSTKTRVDGSVPVSQSMAIEPYWEEIVHAVTWFDADEAVLDRTEVPASEVLSARALPEDRAGFHYLYWSAAPDGEKWTGFGKKLDFDLSLYAVRDADHVVRFVLPNGGELPSRGFRNGQVFTGDLAPEAPVQKRLVFVGWFDDQGRDFSGQKVNGPRRLVARYRRETFGEAVERAFLPLEEKAPLPVVAAADFVLLVVFFVLKPARRKRRRAVAAEPAHDHAAGAAAAEGGETPAPEAETPATGAGSGGATAVVATLLALAPALSSAAEAPAASVPPFDPKSLVYPALVALFALLAALDVVLLFSRIGRGFAALVSAIARRGGKDGGESKPEKEVCPTCGADLVDGECPSGHTIVRCSKCSSIMKDGVCPKCGVGGEQEFCPTCNSELVDGECPRGHTIVRCPDCGSILLEGVCPKGCNADPLNLGWPGGAARSLSSFALKVVACSKSEGEGFTLRVPESFVVGRSSTDAKEPFVELLTVTRKEKAQCSRQYVRFDRGGANGAFTVTLLNSSRNPAFVDGKKLVMQNDSAPISLGGRVRLNPGYELELVEASGDGN